MSSIQGTSGNTSSPLIIDLEDQKKPKAANPMDIDGDGVVDGESLSGDSGQVENSDLLNIILKMRGLQGNDSGGLDSVDGFSVTAGVAPIVTDFSSGVPLLPEDSGLSAAAPLPSGSRPGHFDWMHGTQGVADAALMWMALSTMAETSQQEMSDMKELKNAMQLGKAEAKKNEITSTEERIAAERAAALEGFVWSAVAAAATVVVSSSWGLNNQAVGQAISPAINKFGEYQSKAFGAQAEADEKQVETMRHQLMQELMDQGIEVARSGYDEARELFKLALKILDEHAERETQINSNITRG